MLPLLQARHTPGFILLLGVVCLFSAGCVHSWWDHVTCRDLTWQERLWPSNPDPLEVIRLSNDGAKRGKAFASLREPTNAETRELYLKILTKTALEDREPMCRLGALKALGKFKDPRAVTVLEQVYLLPIVPPGKKGPGLFFMADFNALIRREALASLEATNNPEARHTLIRVAKQPRSEGSSVERQQVIDERLLAINALAKYKQWDSVEALVYVLEEEKDVALRHRARESLQTITGKNLPADAKAWKEAVDGQPVLASNPGLLDRMLGSRPGESLPAVDEAPKENRPGLFQRMFGTRPAETSPAVDEAPKENRPGPIRRVLGLGNTDNPAKGPNEN